MDTEAEASCEIDLEAEVDRVIEKEIKEEEIVVIPLNKNESFTCYVMNVAKARKH